MFVGILQSRVPALRQPNQHPGAVCNFDRRRYDLSLRSSGKVAVAMKLYLALWVRWLIRNTIKTVSNLAKSATFNFASPHIETPHEWVSISSGPRYDLIDRSGLIAPGELRAQHGTGDNRGPEENCDLAST